eukprot:m.296355 g.296355  ORF g.296355 m.296355 type:complete len:337 (-) comp20057_c0_seq2:204-1214(-)
MLGCVISTARSILKRLSAFSNRHRRCTYFIYIVLVGMSWILSSWYLHHREMLLIARQDQLDGRVADIKDLVQSEMFRNRRARPFPLEANPPVDTKGDAQSQELLLQFPDANRTLEGSHHKPRPPWGVKYGRGRKLEPQETDTAAAQALAHMNDTLQRVAAKEEILLLEIERLKREIFEMHRASRSQSRIQTTMSVDGSMPTKHGGRHRRHRHSLYVSADTVKFGNRSTVVVPRNAMQQRASSHPLPARPQSSLSIDRRTVTTPHAVHVTAAAHPVATSRRYGTRIQSAPDVSVVLLQRRREERLAAATGAILSRDIPPVGGAEVPGTSTRSGLGGS